jgi:hypothetical protein
MANHPSKAKAAINALTDFIATYFTYLKNRLCFLTTTMECYISTPFSYMDGREARLLTITLN